ncbi:MAG TPA: GspE/PulE family protein [bacterium]|nr:GspE/PulE family protein [bacterium]HNS33712.1 GspE/PulE family protein [bacterium]HNW09207.1 GspE/PulE family protein [bacterium]HNZ73371.1 GspE/PulE family protein [bacterium]HOH67242.1 GspE/PulE family protein [bacterium]
MLDPAKLKKILLDGSYVSPEDFEKAEKFSKLKNLTVIDYLLSEQLISKDLFGQAIAEDAGLPYADLNTNRPAREQVLKIPETIAKKNRLVLFAADKNELTITTDDLNKKKALAAAQAVFPKAKITIAYSLTEDIDDAFIHYQKSLDTRFARIIKSQGRIAPEILEEIFEDAILYRASDIHFEPQEKELVIRFRIDGVLQEAGRLNKDYYENITNRIKVQAHLRTDEHLAAQDGAIRYRRSDGRATDFRVSVIPTLDGEKIVMRILSEYVRGFSLTDIGLSSRDQELLWEAASKPFGMILVTGPTGSGKTTTLYALLKPLNRSTVNITTIEDPVEYKITGVNQIQVNQRTNLTFAKGLRSIVRQDPDIILVGEIRDEETAEIAVNASLTGHLLLSTFHANDAPTAIPRLLDMEIEPFLLASTLELVVAQRLVRKICEKCRYSYPANNKELFKEFPKVKDYFSGSKTTLYQGKGCSACNKTGYSGRVAIFEFVPITPAMEELILTNPSTKQIWDLARQEGAVSLFEDGLQKVKNGLTTLEELFRVATPPEFSVSSVPPQSSLRTSRAKKKK